MRILAIVNNFPWPGDIDGIFNLRQAAALRSLGHEVRVVRCTPLAPPIGKQWKKYRSVPSRYTIDGFDVTTLRALMPPRSYALEALRLQTRGPVRRMVREFRPDIVHVHGLLPAGVMALDAGIPYVITAHGTETYKLPWLRPGLTAIAQKVARNAAACAGVSDFVASHLRRLGADAASVVFNGADENVFYPRDRAAARARLGLPDDRSIVAFAGHVNAAKGIGELQRAALDLKHRNPFFAIAGEGSMKAELAQTLSGNGIDVKFFPVLDHPALADLMAAADVLALPSHAEGLPTTICEAMNVGCVVVGSAVGGIPEIVQDGQTGFVVPPKDAPALAAALDRVLSEPQLRERFSTAALAFARANLTWSVNARAYERMYTRITAAGTARRELELQLT